MNIYNRTILNESKTNFNKRFAIKTKENKEIFLPLNLNEMMELLFNFNRNYGIACHNIYHRKYLFEDLLELYFNSETDNVYLNENDELCNVILFCLELN